MIIDGQNGELYIVSKDQWPHLYPSGQTELHSFAKSHVQWCALGHLHGDSRDSYDAKRVKLHNFTTARRSNKKGVYFMLPLQQLKPSWDHSTTPLPWLQAHRPTFTAAVSVLQTDGRWRQVCASFDPDNWCQLQKENKAN